jgi:protein SCO1
MKGLLRNPYVLGFLIGIATLTALRPFLRHEPAPPPILSKLPAYTLIDSDGKPYGSEQLAGQVYIVSFFFTQCRSICPVIMQGMAKLQEGFETRGIDGVRLVSISVDPEHDTPEVLRAYAAEHHVNPRRWTLLTGDPEKIRTLVVDRFKTPLETPPSRAPEPIDIAHTGKLVLVDGQGNIRGYYGSDEMGLDEVYNRAQHVLRQAREHPG